MINVKSFSEDHFSLTRSKIKIMHINAIENSNHLYDFNLNINDKDVDIDLTDIPENLLSQKFNDISLNYQCN